MIVQKKNIGTEQKPKYVPDIPDGMSPQSVRYRPDTDDYEVTGGTKTEKWRLEIILEEDGLLDSVNQIVSQANERTQKAWEKAPKINRYSNALEAIRKALELTHEQVDDIFKRANSIEI